MIETRGCPSCGAPRYEGGHFCPRCGNRYPSEPEGGTGSAEWVRPVRIEPPVAEVEEETTVIELEEPPPRRRAGGSWLRIVSLLLLIPLAALALGFALYRFGVPYLDTRRPDPEIAIVPVASPVLPPGAIASPSPSPGTVIIGSSSPEPARARVRVANTEGQGANLRQDPTTTANVVKRVDDGAVLEVVGDDRPSEGRTWRNVRDADGATGWIAAELLGPE